MTETIMEVRNLCKNFHMGEHTVKVLENISFTLGAAESLAITGPSGAGKSTLIHIIGGLERPSSGEILFKGQNIYQMPSHSLDRYRNSNVGFVFQFHYLLDDFSALENVMMPALIKGDDMTKAKGRAEELLRLMGLQDRLPHHPKELSGGEQQRVALARALMNSPTMLLADEPTGSLDRQNSQTVQELLFGLQAMGVALVIVTHDPELAQKAGRSIHLEKV